MRWLLSFALLLTGCCWWRAAIEGAEIEKHRVFSAVLMLSALRSLAPCVSCCCVLFKVLNVLEVAGYGLDRCKTHNLCMRRFSVSFVYTFVVLSTSA